MKELGQKFDNDKRQWTLMPFDALEDVVKVLEKGAVKYSEGNWKHVEPKERYIDAAFRHLIAYQNGERLDSETKESHLAHGICCLLFKLWDDKQPVRVSKIPGSGLIGELRKYLSDVDSPVDKVRKINHGK